ncbi:MAG: sigma-70 family RNA polymerase sigma factor [Acidobacteriia bacterium]|nr:sigma-70 family RNA polymerase sigma factor [Terriglobia bacterium]
MERVGQVLLSDVRVNSSVVSNEIEGLVREHARFVFRVAFSVLRNHHDAEDAAQETFVRVLRHQDDLKTVRDRKLWLARIVWRVAVDRRRRKPDSSVEEYEENGGQLLSKRLTVEQELIRRQRLAFLGRAIQGLPRELRDVVTLSTLEELSGAEIAAVLNIPEVSVRTRMFRARQLLKEKLVTLMEGEHES